jgi:hypothetical protein
LLGVAGSSGTLGQWMLSPSERLFGGLSLICADIGLPWLIEVSPKPTTRSWCIRLDHEASSDLGFDLGQIRSDSDDRGDGWRAPAQRKQA